HPQKGRKQSSTAMNAMPLCFSPARNSVLTDCPALGDSCAPARPVAEAVTTLHQRSTSVRCSGVRMPEALSRNVFVDSPNS
ncbi:MAG TPA: hypothetical protein VM943_11475, partial [Pyrinomonadaceae bacterium]|nr:hypothetical protein [Pyrinomonadaceae bacterium]